MTNERAKLLQLLEEKKELFLEMEQVSEKMLLMDADELTQACSQRQKILDQVQEIDRVLKGMCQEDEEARLVMNHEVQPEAEDKALKALYEMSFAVKAVVNRIVREEEARRNHMEQQRDAIKYKIEELNQSGSSVARQYLQTAKMNGQDLSFLRKTRNF
ncbi:MAG TPA: hypothetical protein H9698_06040 [Candidatus Ruthenibacterium merdavium]|uniref:FlgN protein n=1 Tax=Candidatus Ruthenibacterium merdavium TaxID=2838752 RepID=A0A9D2Q6D6_9FIRM|nr:hypothetical protein [Candidatus Ruthenibacterium merdavium]